MINAEHMMIHDRENGWISLLLKNQKRPSDSDGACKKRGDMTEEQATAIVHLAQVTLNLRQNATSIESRLLSMKDELTTAEDLANSALEAVEKIMRGES